MKTFTISRFRNNLHEDVFAVEADTHEQAAERAAHRLYGNETTARRTTGDPRKGGFFQAYTNVSDSGGWKLSSVGESFHVFED